MRRAVAHPALRLHRRPPAAARRPATAAPRPDRAGAGTGGGVGGGSPALRPTDPRWVLALRVRERLEGALLRPDQRQRLIRLGSVLGLTAFEANLVIAIVQDNARRGGDLGAAVGSLASVPRHRAATRRSTGWRRVALWTGLCLAAEAAVVMLILP